MKEIIGDATLYLGDCLDILPTLDKVDAVVTDVIQCGYDRSTSRQQATGSGSDDGLASEKTGYRTSLPQRRVVAGTDSEALQRDAGSVSEDVDSTPNTGKVSRQDGDRERSLHPREIQRSVSNLNPEGELFDLPNSRRPVHPSQRRKPSEQRSEQPESDVHGLPHPNAQKSVVGQAAIITDPPYGIDFQYDSHQDDIAGWENLMKAFVPLAQKASIFVMPSCQIKRLPWWYKNFPPDWIIAWYKGSPGHVSAIGFNDWEPHLVWGKPPKPMHDYFQTPLLIDKNGHPCPKPIAYSNWLVSRLSAESGLVIDPFMGSGTTGVACMNLGRKFIGIEIEPKYFEIACERIEMAYKQGKLF